MMTPKFQYRMSDHVRFAEYCKRNGIKFATKFDYLAALEYFIKRMKG